MWEFSLFFRYHFLWTTFSVNIFFVQKYFFCGQGYSSCVYIFSLNYGPGLTGNIFTLSFLFMIYHSIQYFVQWTGGGCLWALNSQIMTSDLAHFLGQWQVCVFSPIRRDFVFIWHLASDSTLKMVYLKKKLNKYDLLYTVSKDRTLCHPHRRQNEPTLFASIQNITPHITLSGKKNEIFHQLNT